MQYFYYIYKFLQNQKKEKVIKKIAFTSWLLLVFQMSLVCLFFIGLPVAVNAENDNLCEADVDVVLIIDRSGSMEKGATQSKCEWTERKEVAGQGYYTWFLDIRYDETEQWCMDTRDQFDESSAYYSYKAPTYTPATNSKIVDAKDAAKIFLGNLGGNDQSALVSFADNAILNKTLSDNHIGAGDNNSTEFAINALIADGATNIGDAIALANTELGSSASANQQAVKVIILLTDGKANKPDGNAVQHAKNMADLAALLGYKIFTIGLGADADAGTLQYIADVTNGEFYPSPTSSQLAGIYQSISQKICEYGSISGCKYNNVNNGVATSGIDILWPLLDDWEIILDDGMSTTSQKTVDGCYSFAGLDDGNYTVTEVLTGNWVQTYPILSSHSVIILEHNNVIDINFANYLPSEISATSTISGYKYNDLNNNGLIDDGGAVIASWEIQLIGCPYPSGGAIFLDKNNIDLDVASTTVGNCSIISTTTTDSLGYYEFTGLTAGDYGVSEASSSPWLHTYPANNQFYYFNLGAGTTTTNINFANYLPICGNGIQDVGETCDDGNTVSGDGCSSVCQTENIVNPYCGDGVVNQSNEQCDDGNTVSGDGCSATCQNEGGGGGGGSTPLSLRNEQVICVSETEALVTWLTNKYATSRVVYGIKSQASIGASPNYGYTFSTEISHDNLVSHSVNIAGLEKNTYYFKPIANISSDTFGKEISFNMADCYKTVVLGEEGTPVLIISKTVNKPKVNLGEKNIEFTITVKNKGNFTAFNVKLNDVLPLGISSQYFLDNINDWDLGDIAPNEEIITKYMATVDMNAEAKIYANSASVSADNHTSVSAFAKFEVEKVIVLAETGFKLSELLILVISFLLSTVAIFFIKKRQIV